MVANIIIALISAIVGIGLYIIVTTYITKNTIKKQCAAALKEAEAEGEMIKKEKILQKYADDPAKAAEELRKMEREEKRSDVNAA